MRARRIRRGALAVLVVGAALVLVAACTSSDDDGTEVAGAALERDDDDEPVAVDDERVDPRDELPGPDAESDPADEAEADDAPADSPDDASDDAADGGGNDTGGADDAPTDGGGDASDGGGAPPGQGSEVSPPPPASPTPVTLAAGVGLRGDVVGFGSDGAEVLVGGPVDSPPAVGARADAVRVDGADEVRCHSTLQAPQDRGLVARGDLEIALMIEQHDGASQRVPLLVMELDVSIAAGVRYELPAAPTSGGRGFDRDIVASLACQATFTPRSG